jgi:cytoskeletal protein CcmA (bactofilin family)
MSTIGPDVVISGELTSSRDLVIEGEVAGLVIVRGAALTIAPGARVEADLTAARVFVHGVVHGAIVAKERIELGPASSVDGSLSAEQISIAEGARFNGSIDMGRRTIKARVAEYRAGRVPVE